MSISTVRAAIKDALVRKASDNECEGPRVTTPEVDAVIRAAKDGKGITAGERKLLQDFYMSSIKPSNDPSVPGSISTMACPETSQPDFTQSALNRLANYAFPIMTLSDPESP